MHVRQNIWTINPDPTVRDSIVEAYATAVSVMRERSRVNPQDPTGWLYQSARHDTGPAGIVPPGSSKEQCQHGSWYFLAWHRMYLYFFERIARQAVIEANGPADFALPYWDYSSGAPGSALPYPFRIPADEDVNALYVASPRRYQPVNDGVPLDATITRIKEAMDAPIFAGTIPGFGGVEDKPRAHFGRTTGLLEGTPHNAVHREVGRGGGLMGDPATAALDPIFWLHHANIDRLWNKWRQAGHANSAKPGWLNERFQFHDERGDLQSLAVSDVLESATQLDYVYDDDQGAFAMPIPEQLPERRQPLELVGASDESVTLRGQAIQAEVRVPEQLNEMVTERNRAPGQVVLALEEITVDREPEDVYAVYLNDRGAEPGADRFYVGNLALFGVRQAMDENEDADGPRGVRELFDISSQARELAQQGRWDFREITVTLEPVGFAAENPSPNPIPIHIGRIGLYLG